jgi:hypothetical protein
MIKKGGFDRLFPFYVILARLSENARNGSICPCSLNIPFKLRPSSKKWHCCVEVTHAKIYGGLFLLRHFIAAMAKLFTQFSHLDATLDFLT